jgi:pimeloyl-ACP methyl ester carboxylesterase
VVSLDLRGFGWTDRPDSDYSPGAQARLVLELMDHLEIQRATVVAHSWGAAIALQMALSAPQRVERLALYDAWVYEEQLPTTFKWARLGGLGELIWALFYKARTDEKIELAFYDPERFVTEALVEDVARALDRPGTTAAALAAVRGQRFEDTQARYPAVTQPTLLLWGAADRVARLEFGRRLERELPNAHLVVFERCGHFPMFEAPRASTAALVGFVGGTP